MYVHDRVALLSTFVHVRADLVVRIIKKLDIQVEEFVIVQDGDDTSLIKEVDNLARWLGELPAERRMVHKLRHVINLQRTGCAWNWNTIFRLYPRHSFWLKMSDDVFFEPVDSEPSIWHSSHAGTILGHYPLESGSLRLVHYKIRLD